MVNTHALNLMHTQGIARAEDAVMFIWLVCSLARCESMPRDELGAQWQWRGGVPRPGLPSFPGVTPSQREIKSREAA